MVATMVVLTTPRRRLYAIGMLKSDIGSVCRSHLEFTRWADEKMLAALLQVPADKVAVDLGSSFKSLFETLNHVYLAELVWLKRVQGEPHTRLADLAVPADPNALAEAWPDLHSRWGEWAANRTTEGWNEPAPFRTANGVESTLPFWQILLHVVNHGSYHRGQFTTMLRQSGLTPPATDLMAFYRSL